MYKYLFFFLLLSCKSSEVSMTPQAEAYIEEVIDIMQLHSVNRKGIDWDNFTAKVKAHAVNAKTIADTYPSIQYAVKLLGDGHSYFAPVNDSDANNEREPPILSNENVPHNIGYVRVRYCMGNDKYKEKYINTMIDDIKRNDRDGLKGWIVDLRGNFGGDMSPMLQGIGPVLGEGIVGYTIYPDNRAFSWHYYNDVFYFEGDEACKKVKVEYNIKQQNPYVAVLSDTLTASSGEAVAIAFKGRSKTKSFGWNTYGVSTSNEGFTLSDGSRMLLTVAVFADRNKKLLGVRYGLMQKCILTRHWMRQ